MLNQKKLLLIGVPLAGAALLAVVLTMRRGESLPAKSTARPASPVAAPVLVSARPAPRPEASPEKVVASEAEAARIRSTYQNYRTAVATRNDTLARALLPALERDRETATRLAQQDLTQASTDFDRTVAQKVLQALGK